MADEKNVNLIVTEDLGPNSFVDEIFNSAEQNEEPCFEVALDTLVDVVEHLNKMGWTVFLHGGYKTYIATMGKTLDFKWIQSV